MGNNRVQCPPCVYIVKSRAGCEFVTHHSKSRSGIREGGGDPDTDQPVRNEIGRGGEMGNNRVQCPPCVYIVKLRAGCEFVTHHSKSRSGIREGGGDPDTDQPVRNEIGRGREMGNNRVQCPPCVYIVKSRAGCEFVTHHSKSRSGIREGGGDPDTDQSVRKEIGRGREMGNNRVQCPPCVYIVKSRAGLDLWICIFIAPMYMYMHFSMVC